MLTAPGTRKRAPIAIMSHLVAWVGKAMMSAPIRMVLRARMMVERVDFISVVFSRYRFNMAGKAQGRSAVVKTPGDAAILLNPAVAEERPPASYLFTAAKVYRYQLFGLFIISAV